jgi:hypothetical protein
MSDLGTRWWSQLGEQWAELQRVVGFWQPLPSLPTWTAPALALAAMLALVAVSGIALASLGVLLTALLVAHLLLERVFGVSVAIAAPR